MIEQRQVAIITSLGKKYSGMVDIPNPTLRTTDLFNSANIYWKNPNEKCFDNAVLMYDAKLMFDEASVFRKYDKIQIRLDEIFYFYDDLQSISDEKEKKRASTMMQISQEKLQRVNIISVLVGNSFYDISGDFYGLFKKKSNDRFLPLTNVSMIEISKREGKWFKKSITLPFKFICISNRHIESALIG
ncbi:MAG: hypothetical protein JW932_07115 [Deltaproteobacteria bacterium]|nr:hypothetical protein [Deltaproteobacteria bacterium]